jgi:hypothetical protein
LLGGGKLLQSRRIVRFHISAEFTIVPAMSQDLTPSQSGNGGAVCCRGPGSGLKLGRMGFLMFMRVSGSPPVLLRFHPGTDDAVLVFPAFLQFVELQK